MSARRRLAISLAVLLAVYWIGVLGYMLIDPTVKLRDAIYMVTITLSTVGYREIVPVTPPSQAWTVLLIIFGGLTVAVLVASIAGIVIAGELGRVIGSRKMETRIKQLSHHTIICGFGRMGQLLVERLKERRVPLVVVERDRGRLPEIESMGQLFVSGDATEESVLQRAGIDKAKSLVAALASDADNVFVTLTARQIRPDLQIVARAENSATEPKLRHAGANRVVSPQTIGAERMANVLIRPHVMDFVDVTIKGVELELEQIAVSGDSPLAGKSIRQADIRRTAQIMVVAIRRADGTTRFNPPAEEVVQPGDTLITIGETGAASRLAEMRIMASGDVP